MAKAALPHRPEHLGTADASRPHTAFVLSDGASLGALQVGMLEALYEHDIVPDMLVGSDAAIYGVRLLVDSRLEADIVRYSPEAEPIVLPAPNAVGVQPTSFEYSRQLIADARVAARRALMRQGAGRHCAGR